jgi:two-component system LytT family response regulator
VTAFDEHALQAFEVEAVDYLLKPFDTRRFRKAFERARRRLADPASAGDGPRIARLLEARSPSYLQRLVVSERGRVFFVRVDTVIHLTAEGNYVRVHTASHSHLLRDTLARLERRLDPSRFARIHRSGIVAIDAVKELQPWSHGDSTVILTTGEKLRLSRRYQARLLKES